MRFLLLCFIFLSMHIPCADAHDFKKLNLFFEKLTTDYSESYNIRDISLSCADLINKFDKNLKIYRTQSKAYLYAKQKLVKTWNLPQNSGAAQWQQASLEFLSAGVAYSDTIAKQADILENEALNLMISFLDSYSHIENDRNMSNYIDYTLKDNILYIRPAYFDHNISADLKHLIERHPLLSGIILDLRDNRGGDFNEAIHTADLFLDDALIAYSEEKGHPKHYYSATSGDILNNKPIVILTNERTASAAEIVVAALGEQNRAVIVGTRTYGKGTIQRVYKDKQQKIYLTSGYFYGPSGSQINHLGIRPQICTGIHNSCLVSNKTDLNQDILLAINLIKKKLG